MSLTDNSHLPKSRLWGTESLIDRDESTALKGFVMLLILWGHCHLLADYTGDDGTMKHYTYWRVLYQFHVSAFLILPFVYGCKPLYSTKELFSRFKVDAIRMYVPYIWFTLFSTLVAFVMTRHVDVLTLAKAFIIGANQPLWEESVNATFLWFLPTMVMLLLFRNVFFNCSGVLQIVIVLAAFLMAVPFPQISKPLRAWTPFAIMNAFYYVWPAILVRFFAKKNTFINNSTLWTILFVAIFVISYVGFDSGNEFLKFIGRAFVAATFFMMIYSLRKFFVKSRLLSLVGRYSLQIYLVHLYVYGFLAKVVPHGSELGRIDIGILLFILATIISLVIAVVIMKIPWLKRSVFPKGR